MLISIIVPTYNEAENLTELVSRLNSTLQGTDWEWELVVVDDNSPDGTGAVAEELSRRFPLRVLHRPGKQGLATAVMAGLSAVRGEIVGVMDADLSHPPEAVPVLVEALFQGAEIAVGSRYVAGGGVAAWPLWRRLASRFASLLARPLTPVRDATSGFFFGRYERFQATTIAATGFKIGLEFFARNRGRSIREVPYLFRDRKHGKSKFGAGEVFKYLAQILRLWVQLRA